jgi:DNA adenine methylase
MPITDSPLRYPGGKSQLAPLIIDILRENGLFYGHYCEPFAGGAGIAWTLLLNGYVSHVHLNDLDPAIYALWNSVLYRTDDFCELIDTTSVTIEEWHRQRRVQNDGRRSMLSLGFATFFLNRTNRSGIISGGVIGGVSQNGSYKLDCRFNKSDLIRKIRRIATYRDQVSLHNLDGVDFLTRIVPQFPQNSIVNLDPPYYVRGPELYRNHFSAADHEGLARAVSTLERYWVVTYDDTPETRALYEAFPLFTHRLNYSAQEKRVGTELLALDRRLSMPVHWLGQARAA